MSPQGRMIHRHLLFLFVTIASSVNVANAEDPANTISEFGRSIPIRLRFEPGEEAGYRITTQTTVAQEGAKRDLKTLIIYTIRQKVQSVTEEVAFVDFKVDRLRMTMSGGDADVNFDTQVPAVKRERPELAVLRATVGKSFSARMDAKGTVLDLRGVPTLAVANRYADSRLLQVIGENQLKALLLAQYSWIPEQPVAVSETWTRHEELPLGIVTLIRNNSVTLVSQEGDRLKLSARIDVSHKPSEGIKDEASQVKGEIIPDEVPGQASIVFNKQLGVLESLQASVSFAMKVESTPIGKSKQKPQVVMQNLDAKTKVELISVNGKSLVRSEPLAN